MTEQQLIIAWRNGHITDDQYDEALDAIDAASDAAYYAEKEAEERNSAEWADWDLECASYRQLVERV